MGLNVGRNDEGGEERGRELDGKLLKSKEEGEKCKTSKGVRKHTKKEPRSSYIQYGLIQQYTAVLTA
jgi:hypothetical protein